MPSLLALKAMPWKLIGLGVVAFAVLALFAHDRITVAQNGKLKVQIERLNDQLRAITTAKDTQRKTTGQTIEKAKRLQVDADTRAKVVESAPLKGGCRTPDAVLSADL